MKTLRIFPLVLVLGLAAACTPRDPQVLTRDEKAADDARRNKSSGRATENIGGKIERPGFPPILDLAFTSYLLDRQSEILSVLKLAVALADNSNVAADRCVKLTESERSETTLSYLIDLSNCMRRSGGSTLSQSGTLSLQMEFDANKKLLSLSLSSARLSDETLDAFKLSLSKEGQRGRASMQDQIDLKLKRVSEEPLVFRVLSANAVTKFQSPAGKETLNATVKTKIRGDLTVVRDDKGQLLVQHAFDSILRFDGQVGTAKPVFFDLTLSPRSNRGGNKEILAACPQREGELSIRFDYTPALSRSNHKVTYTSELITVMDEKKPDSKSEMARSKCDVKGPTNFAGMTTVDWSKILIF
jgi:hypothetical protein